MFTYPDWVPPGARARIEFAIKEADDAFWAFKNRSIVPDGDGGYFYRQDDSAAWDAAALEGLLALTRVVVEMLTPVAANNALEPTVRDLVAQRVVWLYTYQHSRAIALQAFTNQVYRALEAFPWWQPFLAATERSASAAHVSDQPILDSRPPLKLKEAAKRLGRSVSTIRRMLKNGQLHSVEIGSRQLIPATEIDRLLKTPQFQFPDR